MEAWDVSGSLGGETVIQWQAFERHTWGFLGHRKPSMTHVREGWLVASPASLDSRQGLPYGSPLGLALYFLVCPLLSRAYSPPDPSQGLIGYSQDAGRGT